MQDKLDGKRHLTTEMSIVAMLKMSLLALQLLPGNASGGKIVFHNVFFQQMQAPLSC